jgi:hypothetical protein
MPALVTHRHWAALRLEPLDRLHAAGLERSGDSARTPGAAPCPADPSMVRRGSAVRNGKDATEQGWTLRALNRMRTYHTGTSLAATPPHLSNFSSGRCPWRAAAAKSFDDRCRFCRIAWLSAGCGGAASSCRGASPVNSSASHMSALGFTSRPACRRYFAASSPAGPKAPRSFSRSRQRSRPSRRAVSTAHTVCCRRCVWSARLSRTSASAWGPRKGQVASQGRSCFLHRYAIITMWVAVEG